MLIETNELLIKGELDNENGTIKGKVQLTGDNVYVRKDPTTSGAILATLKKHLKSLRCFFCL